MEEIDMEVFDNKSPDLYLNPDLVFYCDLQSMACNVDDPTDFLQQCMNKEVEVDAQKQKKSNVDDKLLIVKIENMLKEECQRRAHLLEEKLSEIRQVFEEQQYRKILDMLQEIEGALMTESTEKFEFLKVQHEKELKDLGVKLSKQMQQSEEIYRTALKSMKTEHKRLLVEEKSRARDDLEEATLRFELELHKKESELADMKIILAQMESKIEELEQPVRQLSNEKQNVAAVVTSDIYEEMRTLEKEYAECVVAGNEVLTMTDLEKKIFELSIRVIDLENTLVRTEEETSKHTACLESKLLEADKKKLYLESLVKHLKIQRQKDEDEIEYLGNYCTQLYLEGYSAKYFLQQKELAEKTKPIEGDCKQLHEEIDTLRLKVMELKSQVDSFNQKLEHEQNYSKKLQLKMKEEIDCLQAKELKAVKGKAVLRRLKLEIPPKFTTDPMIARIERQGIMLQKDDVLAKESKTVSICCERLARANIMTSGASTIDIKKWPGDKSILYQMIDKENANYCETRLTRSLILW